jgi:hypothetical protein
LLIHIVHFPVQVVTLELSNFFRSWR